MPGVPALYAAGVQPWEDEDLFCCDLPSSPQPGIGRVLVTGVSGYIGGRLIPELLARGYRVRAMARTFFPEYRDRWPGAEIVVADALEIESLLEALNGIHTAYYLIHSLLLGPDDLTSADLRAARNFRTAAAEKRLKRIVYLQGFGVARTGLLSPRHRNYLRVGAELSRGPVPVTTLRAAMILGSGSASYEMMKHLVDRLPVLPVPAWARHRCQPVAIRDVIKYMVGVLETPDTSGKAYDIGGRDVLSCRALMGVFADQLKKKRAFIPSPVSSIPLYAYITSLLTPVPAAIARGLLEGLNTEPVCRENTIHYLLPFTPLTCRETIARAMAREAQDKIYTRWSNAYPPAHELAPKLHELAEPPRYTATCSLMSDQDARALFDSICRIGGAEGWFAKNWMWRLRGWVDRLLLGVGTARGRRSQATLHVDDVIDFWRIEDLRQDRRVLLRSEMKLPGSAWLEFTIAEKNGRRRLSVTAYYHTCSLWGKVYWYALSPFHHIIFNDLIRQIEKRS